MIKKIALTLVIGLFALSFTWAQKFAMVDINYALKSMPEYVEAQKIIDDLAAKWQHEVEAIYSEVAEKRKAFQQEEILLPEETKIKRLKEIEDLENKAKSLQQKYFGVNGDLFKKRAELIDPLQQKVAKAVQDLAKEKSLDFIMDKGKGNILFVDPKYDRTEDIIKKLKNT